MVQLTRTIIGKSLQFFYVNPNKTQGLRDIRTSYIIAT